MASAHATMNSRRRTQAAQTRFPLDRFRVTIALVVVGIAAISTATAAALIAFQPWPQGRTPPTAAIIDQLAITDPNPDFLRATTARLERAGYSVDYYPPEAVTVELYRTLPKRGYRLVLIRSHSSDLVLTPEDENGNESYVAPSIFTNERYSEKRHVREQWQNRLLIESYTDGRESSGRFFGILPAFVSDSSVGRFKGTTVVLMGCSGLVSDSLAQAFIDKGARDFVSWDARVTAAHTDAATSVFVEHLVTDGGMSADRAVALTMAEIGPDPAFGARLLAYP